MAKDARKTKPGSVQDGVLAESPLTIALSPDSRSRDAAAVQEALDWWLDWLPLVGSQLAPELQSPGRELLEAFRRGRLVTCAKGQKLQEEGEDVRNYTFVLIGKCRLRCKAPGWKPGNLASGDNATPETLAADAAEAAASAAVGIDADGFVTCTTVRAGEPFGQPPGEQRSVYDIVADEPCRLLVLTPEDYAATLRPHQRDLQSKTIEFLQRHRICTAATALSLQRLSVALRPRTIKRGTVILHGGENQRNVFLLREGSFALMETGEDPATLGIEDNPEDERQRDASDEERELRERRDRMREASCGREEQQARAAAAHSKNMVCQYARGRLRQALEEGNRPPSPRPGGHHARPAVVMQAPGSSAGEEVLLFDNLKEMLGAKSTYSVRVEEDSSFYVADLAGFRQLGMCCGSENVGMMLNEKLNRRCSQLTKNSKTEKKVGRTRRKLVRRELERGENPQIRLPQSVGFQGPTEVEDVNGWMRVTFDHRTAPPDEKSPPTLCCLDGLGEAGREMLLAGCGPGTATMLKTFSNQASLQDFRIRAAAGPPRRSRGPNNNPMGSTLQADARYDEVFPEAEVRVHSLAQSQSAAALQDAVGTDGPVGGTGFFQTEIEFDDVQPPQQEQRMPHRASSVPSLPSIDNDDHPSGIGHELSRPSSRGSSTLRRAGEDVAGPSRAATMLKAEQQRKHHVVKHLSKVMGGKSVLMLTDKADVRKTVQNALLESQCALYFLKSTSELWTSFRNKRERYHALILDLGKSEMQVESILRTVRADTKYGMMPIIVLSEDRDLPDVIRGSCSFVVFKPLAASMLREALLWCFNKRALKNFFQSESDNFEGSTVSSKDGQLMMRGYG